MKRLFTLLLSSAVLFATAQSGLTPKQMRGDLSGRQVTFNKPIKKVGTPTSTSRANTESFALDYFSSDNFNSDATGQTWHSYIWNVNSNYSNADDLTLRWGAVLFDSLLLNLYDNTGTQTGTSFINRANATPTLDSFDVYFNQVYALPSSVDTLKVSLFDLSTMSFPGTGAAQNLAFTSVWDTTLIVDAALPLLPGSTSIGALTFHPGYTFPTGAAFGIRVDYTGDTANQFNLLAGYKESCNDTLGANPSVVADNSVYYINYTAGTTNLSGVNSLGFNTPSCGELYIQNIAITAYVSTPLNFTASITPEKKVGCPGTSSAYSAFALGSDSLTNPTFEWYVVPASAGTFDDTTSSTPILTYGTTSGRVYVVVTDDNGNKAYASDSFSVRAINIAINTNPITLSCVAGSTVTIPCTISGYTVGAESYSWSSGQTQSSSTLTGVSTPGTYTVTVTNSAGCTSTASTVVQYPNNVSNTADFTVPANMCANHPFTFVNTSAKKSTGWNSSWAFGDGNIASTTDGINTYSNTANTTYNVTLTMDSAGCTFAKTKQAQVKAICTDVNEVSFEKSVSVNPNPSTGNVTIEIANADKNTSIRIFNILGSEVRTIREVNAGMISKNIDLSDLANGSYLVRIQSGSKSVTKKLILNK